MTDAGTIWMLIIACLVWVVLLVWFYTKDRKVSEERRYMKARKISEAWWKHTNDKEK